MALSQLRSWLCAAACVAICAPQPTPAQQTTPSKEYQLKAVFLFNFAQFVDWPERAFGAADAPLVIGVLGQDPFGSYLDELVRGETINGHSLMVQRYDRPDGITNPHILFISRSSADRMQHILDTLKGRPILTVGDVDGFAGMGGMIRFVTDKNRIRLRINPEAAEAANLKLSSKLLRPADIVRRGED